jgi:L-rhamnose-H+ transport protein
MITNPFIGVIYHWLGGLASGSFYVPYRGVRKWSWEVYWLVGGVFSWLIAPWALAWLMTEDVVGVLGRQSLATLGWTYFFGAMWGVGGLTFGLAMRYLGMSLGMGVALGYCAAFGTLLPPLLKSLFPAIPVTETIGQIAATTSGQITLVGVGLCLVGIAIAALAGSAKEKRMSPEEKKKTVAEFNFSKGLLVATFSGIMSACFSFGLTAGAPIGETSVAAGTTVLWSGLPKLCVVMLGGFTTNFIWCMMLSLKNGTLPEYYSRHQRQPAVGRDSETILETVTDAPGEEAAARAQISAEKRDSDTRVPLLTNYLFSAAAGLIWYLQFFFYSMGETQMGQFHFTSWTLHMASIIVFSTLWGVYFREWRGAGAKAHRLIVTGIAVLVLSTIVIGVGAWTKDTAGNSTQSYGKH